MSLVWDLQIGQICEMFSSKMCKTDFEHNCEILTQNLWFWRELQNFILQNFSLYSSPKGCNTQTMVWLCCMWLPHRQLSIGTQSCERHCYSECYLVLFIEYCTYVHQNIVSELVYCLVLLRIWQQSRLKVATACVRRFIWLFTVCSWHPFAF